MPRALTNQEIRQKEIFILNNAFKLFEDNTFKSFRMDDLAQLSNLSKGILFKYFKSKEMLFIKMLEYEYEKFVNATDDMLIHHNEMTIEEFKGLLMDLFINLLDHNAPFLRLIALRNSVLEDNQDYDFAMKNKTKINDLLYVLVQNILLKVNGLSFNDVQEILDVQKMIISGYLNSYIKSTVVKNVVEDAQLEMFKGNYKEIAIKLFRSYLQGV